MKRLAIKELFAEYKVRLEKTHAFARVVWHLESLLALCIQGCEAGRFYFPCSGREQPPLALCMHCPFRKLQGCQLTWQTW